MSINLLHPEKEISTEELVKRVQAIESSDQRYALRGGLAVTYDSNGRIATLNVGYLSASVVQVGGAAADVNAGVTTINGGKITANSISATQIEANAVTASEIAANAVTADKISVSELSAIVANLGTITAGSITGVTITGNTISSSSGNQKIRLTSGDLLEFFYGGSRIAYYQTISNGVQLVGDFLATKLWVGSSTGTPSGVASFRGDVEITGNLDMDAGNITDTTWIGESSSKRIEFNQSGRIQVNDDFDPSSSSNYNLGGNDRYWQDVHCQNIVDHSMGLYDEGFKDKNGNKITDVQAIVGIKAHPTRKMDSGRPYLDKRTFPKEFFQEAYNKETKTFYKRDKDNRPYRHLEDGTKEYVDSYDGVSLTQVVALLLGAIKEVNQRLEVLEAK